MVLLLMGQLVACKKDDIAPPIDRTNLPRTIGQFIKNNYDLSLLHAALEKTNLLDSLEQPNYGTFFAPDNAAFNYIGIASKADVDRLNTDSLRKALRGHVISQRIFVSQFPVQMGSVYTTKTGSPLYLSVNGNSFNGAEERLASANGVLLLTKTKRNIALSNGVVHMIYKPMQYHAGTVQDYLAADTSLRLFVVAMKRFNYWDGFKTKNPLTIMAPNNAAFAKKGITADSINRMVPASFDSTLFGIYHFEWSPKRIFTTDAWLINGTIYGETGIKIGRYSLAPNYSFNSWNNTESSSVDMYTKNNGFWGPNSDGPSLTNYVGGTTRNADHLTDNGLVHVIDNLLLYPENLRK